MSREQVQNDLVEAYAEWKVGLRFNDGEAKIVSAPYYSQSSKITVEPRSK